jgi:hypothetical protein
MGEGAKVIEFCTRPPGNWEHIFGSRLDLRMFFGREQKWAKK